MQHAIITVFEEPERTSLDRIEAYADKGNIISSKRERTFLRNFFVICEFLSKSTSQFSGSSLLTLFSWNLQREIWEPLGAMEKKDISTVNN